MTASGNSLIESCTSSMRTLKLCEGSSFHSNQEYHSKAVYAPGYNNHAFQDYVKSQEFVKKSETVRKINSSSNKQRNTYPLTNAKKAGPAEYGVKESSIIWRGSVSSSKADLEDLLDFVKKKIEKKEMRGSQKQINVKKTSIISSASRGSAVILPPVILPPVILPPIIARKATIHSLQATKPPTNLKNPLRFLILFDLHNISLRFDLHKMSLRFV